MPIPRNQRPCPLLLGNHTNDSVSVPSSSNFLSNYKYLFLVLSSLKKKCLLLLLFCLVSVLLGESKRKRKKFLQGFSHGVLFWNEKFSENPPSLTDGCVGEIFIIISRRIFFLTIVSERRELRCRRRLILESGRVLKGRF